MNKLFGLENKTSSGSHAENILMARSFKNTAIKIHT